MFNKYQNIFRSRWKALWWAAGVCLTAYCTVPSADHTARQEAAAQHKPAANPWALDKSPADKG
jgi:hypothetical protein